MRKQTSDDGFTDLDKELLDENFFQNSLINNEGF